MRYIKHTLFLLGTLLLMVVMPASAAIRVNVVGLFNNKAIVMINGGGPHSLSAGQTKQGVKLVSANSGAATFVIEGKRQVLGMGQAVSVAAASPATSASNGVNQPVTYMQIVQVTFLAH